MCHSCVHVCEKEPGIIPWSVDGSKLKTGSVWLLAIPSYFPLGIPHIYLVKTKLQAF